MGRNTQVAFAATGRRRSLTRACKQIQLHFESPVQSVHVWLARKSGATVPSISWQHGTPFMTSVKVHRCWHVGRLGRLAVGPTKGPATQGAHECIMALTCVQVKIKRKKRALLRHPAIGSSEVGGTRELVCAYKRNFQNWAGVGRCAWQR